MNLNFLSALGAGIDPNADYSPPAVPAPQGVPENLLAGIPGYGAASAPSAPAAAPPPIAQAQPPVNALQALNPGAPADAAPPLPAASSTPSGAPQPRRSILDTVGRLADVFAKVGGADALYQPTLDGREDRTLMLGDHARKVDLDKLALASGQMDNSTQGNKILGQALRGLQAITAANPQADASKIWPLLAQQSGIPADRAAAVGQAITAHPELVQGIIDSATDPKDDKTKFGFQPIYTTDAEGKLHVHQLSSDGSNQIPAGETPIDPLKFVDTGGAMVGVGTRTGNPTRILPKSIRPDTAANNQTQRDIAAGKNATQIQIAGMPARGKAGDGKGGTGDVSNVPTLLDNIQKGFSDLHGINALPGDKGGAVSNVLSALGRTGLGQSIGEQAGSASAQKRLEIMKNVSALQQAMLKSLPASATRTKFEQEMLARGLPDPSKMSYGTAQTVIGQLRESYARAVAATRQPAARPGPAAPRIQPRAPARGRGPSVSNW